MQKTKKFPVLAFCVLLFSTWVIYGMGVLLPRSHDLFPAVSGADGAYYVLRLKTALMGDSIISCPFDPHLKSHSTFIPSFMESSWASILKPLVGVHIKKAVSLTYLILPPLLYILLVFFLYRIFSSAWLAVVVGYWGVMEDSVYFWKPFSLSLIDPSEPLPYFRFANPMLFQIPFLIAFGSFFHLIQTSEKRKDHPPHPWLTLWVITAVGLLFYVQIYYAVYFVVLLTIFGGMCIYNSNWTRARLTLAILGGAVLIGTPEIIRGMNLLVSPGILEIVHRIGLLIRNRMPYFLLHKGFLTTFIIYQVISWKNWGVRWKMLTAAMVAGYFCLNQALFTGLASHDHHYFRPMMITYIFVMADTLTQAMRIWPKLFQKRTWVLSAGLLFCLLITAKGANAVMNLIHRDFNAESRVLNADRIKLTVQKVEKLPDRQKALLLVDPDYTYIFEIIAGIPVFIDEYFYHCITGDDELFRRWAILLKSFGWDKRQVNKKLREFVDSTNLSYWLYGLPASFSGSKNRYSPEDQDLRLQSWVAAYEKESLSRLLRTEIEEESAPTYLLESPRFKADLDRIRNVFRTEMVFEVPEEGTRLWKLVPLKI